MKAVGTTTDGKVVVSGVGKLYFEGGLPLSVVFEAYGGDFRDEVIKRFR